MKKKLANLEFLDYILDKIYKTMEMMMKKSLTTLASALVLTMAISATAEARDGFYIAVSGVLTDYNLNSKDDAVSDTARMDFNSVWNVSGALGYKYKYFRIEGEYTYRDDDEDDYKNSFGRVASRSSLESDSFMANAYLDIMPNYWISPFISGGIGMTRLDVTNQDVGAAKKSWSEDNFTWQLGAGLSLRINRCLNFDAGYRYVDMGEIDDADINGHEWYGGLRYTF